MGNIVPLFPNGWSPLSNVVSNRTIDFALIIKGQCNYNKKIQNAQSAGSAATIAYDDWKIGLLNFSKSKR